MAAEQRAADVVERLHDDALRAVLVRLSFTWYGVLRTTCRRLREVLSNRDIWTARRAAGIEEEAFVVKVTTRDGIPSCLDFFVPRVGGGWVQLPSPAPLPEKEFSAGVFAIEGCLFLRLAWLMWSSYEWQKLEQSPFPLPVTAWVGSIRVPWDDELCAFKGFDDRHCYIGIYGNEELYDDGECPSDEKTRLFVLRRGERSWTRLADPPYVWNQPRPISLEGRLLCKFSLEGVIRGRSELWAYTLKDDRWDRLETPARYSFDCPELYDQGFVISPCGGGTALDEPFYHGTFDAVDADEPPRVTYTSLHTPAPLVATAWAQAARELDFSVHSPVLF